MFEHFLNGFVNATVFVVAPLDISFPDCILSSISTVTVTSDTTPTTSTPATAGAALSGS